MLAILIIIGGLVVMAASLYAAPRAAEWFIRIGRK